MSNPAKQIVLGTALLVGITMVGNAEPVPPTGDKSAASGAAVPSGARQLSSNEVSALSPSNATPTRDSIKLPGVSVVAPFYLHSYTSGMGPKAGPNGIIRAEHYQTSSDYVRDIAMRPYTSGVASKAGPNFKLKFVHYDVPPDYKKTVAMHPYSSGLGPAVESKSRAGDGRANLNGRE